MIKIATYFCLTTVAFIAVVGCGEVNDDNVFSSSKDEGHYQSDWLEVKHIKAATDDLESCTACHGEDLSGGISKASCTVCHIGDALSAHPLDWGDYSYSKHDDYIKDKGYVNALLSCNTAICHGTDWKGGTTGPSCKTCHMGGIGLKHPTSDIVIWAKGANEPDSHAAYVKNNGIDVCANKACHGEYLEGAEGTGMSCKSCHSQNW